MTLFIQPCIGQGFCPFAPQLYFFGPVASAVADEAPAALVAGETALDAALATSAGAVAEAFADAAFGSALGASAVAEGTALAVGAADVAAAEGFASVVAAGASDLFSLHPNTPANATITTSCTTCLILLSSTKTSEPASGICGRYVSRRSFQPTLPRRASEV